MRKLIISFLVAIAVLSTVFIPGCSGNTAKDGLNIVCTLFPQYDFVRAILGDKINDVAVTYLLDDGSDIHNYKNNITAADKITIISSDLLIFVGGESDRWIEQLLEDPSRNPDLIAIPMLDIINNPKLEEDNHEEIGYQEHEETYDEHVWLSVKNSIEICNAICDAFVSLDPENADIYRHNVKNYVNQLEALDNEYKEMVESSKRRVVVFADRYPFRYLMEDYSITCYAALPGCSTETDAKYENIIALSKVIDEYDIPYLLTLENSKINIADQVINNSKKRPVKIGVLNSLQSVTSKEIEAGISYLSVMRQNLEVLKGALN
ncbi:MAG TPA: zinc ABC transporter substrate-binding protein [Clostridiales bacterium]|nr:zinc ABC transporter substrate-binding protein [Clostridiales bacterium]